MTKEENSLYLLVKQVLTKAKYNHSIKKLPKTMTTVRWVKNLKELLTRRYGGFVINVYSRTDNHWSGTVCTTLRGKVLNQAVEYMLVREISANINTIVSNPYDLPLPDNTECMERVRWVLDEYLPSRFKLKPLTN